MNIFAFTENNPLQPAYPGYVSINRDANGDVCITVREQPKVYEGVFVCAHRQDAGPGRCVAGDENCNNYCNMAPQKGPMADHPLRCTHVDEGRVVSMTIPSDQWKLGDS